MLLAGIQYCYGLQTALYLLFFHLFWMGVSTVIILHLSHHRMKCYLYGVSDGFYLIQGIYTERNSRNFS